MAKKAAAAQPHPRPKLSAAELKLIERLIESGTLIAVPSQANARPRKVSAAGLAHGGKVILLYLSPKPMSFDRE